MVCRVDTPLVAQRARVACIVAPCLCTDLQRQVASSFLASCDGGLTEEVCGWLCSDVGLCAASALARRTVAYVLDRWTTYVDSVAEHCYVQVHTQTTIPVL